MISALLISCGGSPATAQPTPTRVVLVATPTSTPTPAATPTPPSATPTPTSPPLPSGSAILDLQPATMSIVGHLDCQVSGSNYICMKARVISRAGNAHPLNWVASTNVPGHISFSPASGTLLPGQSVIVTITVPTNACTHGLFIFRGQSNTHTITWAC